MMIGPRDPNVLLWLSSLAPADRLATMLALTHLFTLLTVDKEWQGDIAELRRELQPTWQEAEDLLVRAAAIGAMVKREMVEAGAKPVTGRKRVKRVADQRQTNLLLPVAGGKEKHGGPDEEPGRAAASRNRLACR